MKYLKVILGTFGAISVLLMVGFLVGLLLDTGPTKDEEVTWTPPTEIQGITLGMTRSDAVFQGIHGCSNDGVLVDEEGDPRTCSLVITKSGLRVRFSGDVVVKLDTFRGGLPNSVQLSVEELVSKLGEPDFLYTSDDLAKRTYTYLNHRTSHYFLSPNETFRYVFGDISWEDVTRGSVLFQNEPLGELVFRGRPLCPSPQCPFNEDKSLKDDYPYKTPFDLP